MPIKQLEEKIVYNIRPHFEKISQLTIKQKIEMMEDVKNTRKTKFRFAQEKTQNISKDRIQIALSYLAKLFKELDVQIKNEQRNA